jgi:3-dehydroquinate dehydratase/shikimate dehydrogenase
MRRQMVVFDTVYNPEQTLLIKEARDQGCRTVTGVDMFVRQAAMQFKLFTRQAAPVSAMLENVRRAIGAARVEGEVAAAPKTGPEEPSPPE